jgi:hypothetical protein
MKEPERYGIRRIEKYVPGIGIIRTYKRDFKKGNPPKEMV